MGPVLTTTCSQGNILLHTHCTSQVFFLFSSKYTRSLNSVLLCGFLGSEVNYTNLYTCHIFYTQSFEKVPELTIIVSESASSVVGFDVFLKKNPLALGFDAKD